MKHSKTVVLVLSTVLLMILLSSCLAIEDAKQKAQETWAVLDVDYNGKVITDLRYGEAERNLYDLYLPEDTSKATNPKVEHLILFIHGGSWTSGSKEDGARYCRNFSDHGYVSASISYTLKDDGIDISILMINDEVKAAVQSIKDKCSELGIELKDMAVSGFSAGACQAMMYGFKEAKTSALEVKFILQQSGPTTFDPEIWNSDAVHWTIKRQAGLDGTTKGDANWISLFSGQKVTETMVQNGEAEPIWRSISPFSYITDDSIPILSAYGVYDSVVPPESRNVLEQALEAAGQIRGTDFDTIVMEHSGHMLAGDVDKQRLYLQKVYEYCDQYFE